MEWRSFAIRTPRPASENGPVARIPSGAGGPPVILQWTLSAALALMLAVPAAARANHTATTTIPSAAHETIPRHDAIAAPDSMTASGIASYYAHRFHGRRTAS